MDQPNLYFKRISFSFGPSMCLSLWQYSGLLKIEVYYGNADRPLNRALYFQTVIMPPLKSSKENMISVCK